MNAPAEERPRVAYLGPEGTFSEEALLSAVERDAVEPLAKASFHDAVAAVREGEAQWAIVPIENSLDGSVTVTLDLLAAEAERIEIVGETLLRVRHSLIASAPVELGEIDTVLTHPQVPGQCAGLLRGELAGARVLPASSTAEAVRTVARERRAGLAAIGTALAADIYGAVVLRADVEDRADNETRFVWLGRVGDGRRPELRGLGEGSRTSLVFWGVGTEHAGWLVRCLDEFARREVNLTKIESRPRREGIGTYMFFADLEGQASEQALADGIRGLRGRCEDVHVLGSCRRARGG